jgi:hypothetical protein
MSYLDVYNQIKSIESVFKPPIDYVTIDVGTFDVATGALSGLTTTTETDPEPPEHGPNQKLVGAAFLQPGRGSESPWQSARHNCVRHRNHQRHGHNRHCECGWRLDYPHADQLTNHPRRNQERRTRRRRHHSLFTRREICLAGRRRAAENCPARRHQQLFPGVPP